jgi:hypothetical protein
MIFSALLEIIRAPIVWLFDKFMPSRQDMKSEQVEKDHKANVDKINEWMSK